jgi:hypothetical protein
MIKSGNPKQNMLNILRERAQGNPMFANMLSLAQSGNTQEIEKIARNVAQEKGLDFDTEFNSFKQKFGL